MIEYLEKGKARFRVSVGGREDRKRYTKTVTYSTKKELMQMYREFEEECQKIKPNDLTVDELLGNYIEKKKMLGLKPTTERGYLGIKSRLNERFAGVKANSLTTYQLEKTVTEMCSEKGFFGKQYSSKTIHNTMALLSAAYEDAVRTGLLTCNPCRNVLLPKREVKEKQIMDAEQMLRFLEALRKERVDYRVGYGLCLFCGLRRSEALGLKEADVDAENRIIRVRNTRHVVKGRTFELDTKTARSTRTLAVPKILAEDIKELLAEHEAFPYQKSEFLVQNGFGEPMNPSVFSNHIYVLERNNGLPQVSAHGLRHTFASLLNAEGVDMARISAELGHSNLSTTMNIYTHVFGGASASSRDIADTIDRFFSEKENEGGEGQKNP